MALKKSPSAFSLLAPPLDKVSSPAYPAACYADGHDYVALLKLRVMALVVFTALTGLMLAPGTINPILGFIAIFTISLAGASAGALNMWYDADIDALMRRTAKRPIPAGLIRQDQAFWLGLFLGLIAILLMGIFINWFSAFFLAFTIFFYVVIYTIWLKRRTPQNIVIGGAAGAFPPMIGWSAVSGGVDINSISLFLLIFLWTPPHFWSLALFTKLDYDAASIPMLPNIAGTRATQNQIFIYTLIMSFASLLPFLLGFAGVSYGIVALLFSAYFSYRAYLLWRAKEQAQIISNAKKTFFFSLLYLAVLFGLLLLEHCFSLLLRL